MEQAEDVQSIIVVDDDACVRETLEIALTGAGHSVRATDCGSEALRWLDDEPCRKLPRQIDTSKADFRGASGLGRNATGGTWPRLSWGRSVL